MYALAALKRLARQNANGVPPRAKFARISPAEIPPTIWNEIEIQLNHNPRLALALARLIQEIGARHPRARLRVQADCALVRALNVCGEFREAVQRGENRARRFERSRDTASAARVWLEAAWAETHLGNLEAAEADLKRALALDPALTTNDGGLRLEWIRARILRERGDLHAALKLFTHVRAQLLAKGEKLDATRVLREMGHTQARINPKAARVPLRKAQRLFILHQCPIEAALCNHWLAQALIDTNRFAEAEHLLLQNQSIFRKHALAFFEAGSDMEVGVVYAQLNRFRDLLTHSARARAKYVEFGGVQEISSCDVNIGVALEGLDRDADALIYYQRALQSALATARRTKAALCLLNIGGIYDRQGRYAQALEHFQRAREEFVQENMTERLVECDLRLGRVYFHLGDYSNALTALNRAQSASRRGKMLSRLGQAELYRGQLFMALDQPCEARAALRRARHLFVRNQETVYAAFCDRERALLYDKNPTLALQLLATARRIFKRNGQQVEATVCDLVQGELYLRWKQNEKARVYFERAEHILGASFPDYAWRAQYGLGRVALSESQPKQSLPHLLNAVHTIAQLRGGTGQEQLSNRLFAVRQDIFAAALHAAFTAESLTAVFSVIEAGKAQTFVHLLGQLEWDGRTRKRDSVVRQALLERERYLRERIMALRQQISLPPPASALPLVRGTLLAAPAAALHQLKRLNRQHETVIARLRAMQLGLAGVPTLAPFDLAAFRKMACRRWEQDWAALDYYFDEEQLVIGYLDAQTAFVERVSLTYDQRVALERCTATETDMRELVYRGTLGGLAVPLQVDWLETLVSGLLPPRIQRQLDVRNQAKEQDVTLLISPHGVLHQLPFHALKQHGRHLLERYAFIYTPALQALYQLQTTAHTAARHTLLCGVDEFGARAQPLPFVKQEIRALQRQLRHAQTTLWRNQATRQQLLAWNEQAELKQFDRLHFATHTLVDWRFPNLSRILLYDQDLTVLDISTLKLRGGLVILSSCSSALGTGGHGDEWISLARSFFYAGARTLVASLWAARDESTALLMKQLYRALDEGAGTAQALRAAQLSMLRMGYVPYDWAAFTVIGVE